MTDLPVETQKAILAEFKRNAEIARNKEIRATLEAMVEEQCDYMIINKLGDPEKQHNIKRARAVLGGN